MALAAPAAPRGSAASSAGAGGTAPPPANGSEASGLLAAASQREEPSTIYFAGDSMANGYAAGGAMALSQAKSKSKAVDAGRISTGLVSKSYYDWGAKARELCDKSPGAMVFSFGANDPMDMRENGRFLRFGSSEWMSAYGERALDVERAAKACGAKTVWLMLPPMRDPAMERKAQSIRLAQAQACAEADACVKPFEGLGEASERFMERASIQGRPKLLRAPDGIHMAPEGYLWVARQALDKLALAKASVHSAD